MTKGIQRKYQREYRIKNKEAISRQRKAWYQKNRVRILQAKKDRRDKICKTCKGTGMVKEYHHLHGYHWSEQYYPCPTCKS